MQEDARAEVPRRRRSATSRRRRIFGLYEAHARRPADLHRRQGRPTCSSARSTTRRPSSNLTEARLRKLNRVAWSDAAARARDQEGQGQRLAQAGGLLRRRLPVLPRLENEIKGLDNVTIYTFLFPIDQLHPDAARKSRMIWCAPDRHEGVGRVLRDAASCPTTTATARTRSPRRRRSDNSSASTRRRRWSSPTARWCPARCRSRSSSRSSARPTSRRRGSRRRRSRGAAGNQFRTRRRRGREGVAIIDFLKKQFIDIIEWTDDSRDTLSFRFPDEDKEIKNGAQLIVRESQVAQFVYLGQFGDTVRSGQAHADDRQHPDPDQPQELEVRAREPVQGRRLLRRHARVHRQQVGHRQSGDDARRRISASSACAPTAPTISASSTRRSS